MPGVILRGATSRKPTGQQSGSSFQDAISQATSGDPSALKSILQPEQLAYSPAYQSGNGRQAPSLRCRNRLRRRSALCD